MTELNPMERAAVAVSLFIDTPARTYEVGPEATIQLAEGTGHLLDGATLTAWTDVDIATGRCE